MKFRIIYTGEIKTKFIKKGLEQYKKWNQRFSKVDYICLPLTKNLGKISDIEYKKILEKNGFEVESIELIDRPTKIEDIKVWLDIFANGITKNLTTKQKEIFKEEVEKILKNKIYSEEFGWLADYVRLRVVANKL